LKHQGKILEKAIRNSHISITKIAELLGYTGRNMYNLFDKEELPNELFIRTGKIIGYDYSKDLPELTEFLMLREPQEAYNINAGYQQKYLELLEKHMKLKEEYDFMVASQNPNAKKAPIKKKK
jgi:hypothetical protein